MSQQDFLLEIGCEELPARYLWRLATDLKEKLTQTLSDAKLAFGEARCYATPRRLAVLIEGLDEQGRDGKKERHGPFIKDAYDKDGTPTLACLGFAKSCGVPVDQLQRQETPRGERVCVSITEAGQPTVEQLPELITQTLKRLPLPKPMRWGTGELSFLRPVRWVVMLFGNASITTTVLGQKTQATTYGHRFHHPQAVTIPTPKEYNAALYGKAYVVPDLEQRRQLIEKRLNQAAGQYHAIIEPDLLNEVTALVEWPVALLGNFDKTFLKLPREVLITTLKTHQKTFPVEDAQGNLQPHFIVISNIESKDPQAVITGNERVINARLRDAKFFYDNDLKTPLASRANALDAVVFQQKLGSIGDKQRRLTKLATYIAKQIEADVETTKQAAGLSKCDLITEMVYEFPTLQGIMGHYYALHDHCSKDVARAIQEQYWPKFSGDKLPTSNPAACLALADRLDTLVGIIGINQLPTGDKDPFALRRAAQGIYRILIEKSFDLDLQKLITHAIKGYSIDLPNAKTDAQAFDFIVERMRYWYLDQNVPTEVFESVLATETPSPLDFHRRLEAVQAFIALPEASTLASANKRVSNILKKQNHLIIPKRISEKLLEAPAEKALSDILLTQAEKVNTLYDKANYTAALSALACLKTPVDQFFEEVMVMDKDEKKRNNRLALLSQLQQLFTQVADIAHLTPLLEK